MQSFTGPEIAALIDNGSVIAAHEVFSTELERQMIPMSGSMREHCSYLHWIRGVYLITSVEPDDPSITLPLASADELRRMRDRLGADLRMTVHNRRLRLLPEQSLEGLETADELRVGLEQLKTPATICLGPEEEPDCGDDHVVAIGLHRPLTNLPQPALVQQAIDNVTAKYSMASQVQITHFRGGPCDEHDIRACVVLGGSGRGYQIETDLEKAIETACGRAVKRYPSQGNICGGQTVRLEGLQSCPELNGEIGLTLRFVHSTNGRQVNRWLVRLRNGDGKQIKPANLVPLDGDGGRVFVVWGDARWSRAQLLGEIARGHWGLCRANISDLTSGPGERWSNTDGRLAFAPQTDMTEDFMRHQMQRVRAAVEAHQPLASDDEPDDDDE